MFHTGRRSVQMRCPRGHHFIYINFYISWSVSEDTGSTLYSCVLLVVWLMGKLRRSFPPGLEDALPYHIIPAMAMVMPRITCKLRPSFPKKTNPKASTRIVFMCPRTWKDTAVNLPMQMNWLRFVPTAMVQEIMMNNCKQKKQISSI